MRKVIVVTHAGLASGFKQTIEEMIGGQPHLYFKEYDSTQPLDDFLQQVEALVRASDADAEALILTDLFGATPQNVALIAAKSSTVAVLVLSGINLAMILAAVNEMAQAKDLQDWAARVISAGQSGIMNVTELLD
ncbi:MAG: PTS sugar transporter subunit IIA [Lacticaseibacillus paracasei]